MEHVHTNTSNRSEVSNDGGPKATRRVVLIPARESTAAALPQGYVALSGRGGGVNGHFFVHYYVDDGVLVEVQRLAQMIAVCVHRRRSVTKLSIGRGATDPPLLSENNISHWNTQLEVLGWPIDSVAMPTSLADA